PDRGRRFARRGVSQRRPAGACRGGGVGVFAAAGVCPGDGGAVRTGGPQGGVGGGNYGRPVAVGVGGRSRGPRGVVGGRRADGGGAGGCDGAVAAAQARFAPNLGRI